MRWGRPASSFPPDRLPGPLHRLAQQQPEPRVLHGLLQRVGRGPASQIIPHVQQDGGDGAGNTGHDHLEPYGEDGLADGGLSLFRDPEGNAYMAYHARNYDEIEGDPLYDPNRHTYVMRLEFKDGMPVFSTDNQLFI